MCLVALQLHYGGVQASRWQPYSMEARWTSRQDAEGQAVQEESRVPKEGAVSFPGIPDCIEDGTLFVFVYAEMTSQGLGEHLVCSRRWSFRTAQESSRDVRCRE
ncbi:uncharacterized protein FN964_001600 [Alca torda]